MKPGLTFFRTLLALLLLVVACAAASGDEITVNMVSQVLQSFDPDEAGRETARTWVLPPALASRVCIVKMPWREAKKLRV